MYQKIRAFLCVALLGISTGFAAGKSKMAMLEDMFSEICGVDPRAQRIQSQHHEQMASSFKSVSESLIAQHKAQTTAIARKALTIADRESSDRKLLRSVWELSGTIGKDISELLNSLQGNPGTLVAMSEIPSGVSSVEALHTQAQEHIQAAMDLIERDHKSLLALLPSGDGTAVTLPLVELQLHKSLVFLGIFGKFMAKVKAFRGTYDWANPENNILSIGGMKMWKPSHPGPMTGDDLVARVDGGIFLISTFKGKDLIEVMKYKNTDKAFCEEADRLQQIAVATPDRTEEVQRDLRKLLEDKRAVKRAEEAKKRAAKEAEGKALLEAAMRKLQAQKEAEAKQRQATQAAAQSKKSHTAPPAKAVVLVKKEEASPAATTAPAPVVKCSGAGRALTAAEAFAAPRESALDREARKRAAKASKKQDDPMEELYQLLRAFEVEESGAGDEADGKSAEVSWPEEAQPLLSQLKERELKVLPEKASDLTKVLDALGIPHTDRNNKLRVFYQRASFTIHNSQWGEQDPKSIGDLRQFFVDAGFIKDCGGLAPILS